MQSTLCVVAAHIPTVVHPQSCRLCHMCYLHCPPTPTWRLHRTSHTFSRHCAPGRHDHDAVPARCERYGQAPHNIPQAAGLAPGRDLAADKDDIQRRLRLLHWRRPLPLPLPPRRRLQGETGVKQKPLLYRMDMPGSATVPVPAAESSKECLYHRWGHKTRQSAVVWALYRTLGHSVCSSSSQVTVSCNIKMHAQLHCGWWRPSSFIC